MIFSREFFGLLLALFVMPLVGFASGADFCKYSDAQLRKANNSCLVNEIFVGAAALTCLKNFEIEISKLGMESMASLVGGKNKSLKKKDWQQEFYNGARTNYDATNNRLAWLIERGKKNRARVNSYLGYIVFPEDYDRRPNILQESPCYVDNVNLIKSILKDIDENILDLEAAYGVSNRNKVGSAGSEKHIEGNEAPVRKLSSSPDNGSPKVKRRKGPRASDISGEIKPDDLPRK